MHWTHWLCVVLLHFKQPSISHNTHYVSKYICIYSKHRSFYSYHDIPNIVYYCILCKIYIFSHMIDRRFFGLVRMIVRNKGSNYSNGNYLPMNKPIYQMDNMSICSSSCQKDQDTYRSRVCIRDRLDCQVCIFGILFDIKDCKRRYLYSLHYIQRNTLNKLRYPCRKMYSMDQLCKPAHIAPNP